MNKLYTQSEVERAIIEFIKNEYKLSHPNLDKVIASLNPVELPSDEEIIAEVREMEFSKVGYKGGVIEGMMWMRDKIKGGNNG